MDHFLYMCIHICHLYVEIHLHQYTYSLQSIPFSIGCYVKFSKIVKIGYVVTIKPQPNWALMDASDTPFRNFQV